jgi:NitT/TauT family transport system ATP-binding protein
MTTAQSPEHSKRSPFVIVEDASLLYQGEQGVLALEHFDLSIMQGEFSAVVGPSGCGKSTLMKLISGLSRPTAGRVVVGDAEVKAPLKNVGMAFQNPALLPWRTALENLLLPL